MAQDAHLEAQAGPNKNQASTMMNVLFSMTVSLFSWIGEHRAC